MSSKLVSDREKFLITKLIEFYVGRDNVVGIATGYGLDGPEMESLWGRDFSHLFRQAYLASSTFGK